MTALEEGMRPEAPKVSTQKVRSLLLKAGEAKAGYTGYVYANDGFKLQQHHGDKMGIKVMVQWMPQHTYGVASREEIFRQGQRRQMALARYRKALEAAGLPVEAVEYSEGGNVAYLLVG